MEQGIYCPALFDGTRLRHDVLLRLHAGRVAAVVEHCGASEREHCLQLPGGSTIAPGLIDIQLNGGGGVLFNDDPTLQTIAVMAQAHRPRGTTAFLPTLITDTREQMRLAVDAARAACQAVPGVLGIHLEGPFLHPARRGIHRADRIANFGSLDLDAAADLQLMTALGDAGRTLVTLAPECVRSGTVRALHERGALVFAGHTEASYEQVQSALTEGLAGFTHLFNAMSQLGPRTPGTVGAALLTPQAYAGLILDGHHVASGSVAVLRAARGMERVILVSDAMACIGTTATGFMLQGQRIRVDAGRCIDAAGTLAGAAITLADAVRIGVSQYGLQPEQALASATRIPAELLGLSGSYGVLQVGARADAVVLDAQWRPIAVMQDGSWVRPLERMSCAAPGRPQASSHRSSQSEGTPVGAVPGLGGEHMSAPLCLSLRADLSDAAKAVNEDAFGHHNGWLRVLDGATGVAPRSCTPGPTDAAWLAHQAFGDDALDGWRAARRTSSDPAQWHMAARQTIVAHRDQVNRPGGYWVLHPRRAWLPGVHPFSVPGCAGTRVLMASDGFYRLADLYAEFSDEQLVQRAFAQGLAPMVEHLRAIERSDPDCDRFARIKVADDATCLLAEVLACAEVAL